MLCKKHLGNGEPRAGASRIRERYSVQVSSGHRGRSLMVKPLPSKQITRVRFSSPAPLDLSSPHHTQIFLARRVRTATKTADSDFSTGLIAQPGTSHPRFWQAPRCGQSLRFWAVQTDSNAGFCPPCSSVRTAHVRLGRPERAEADASPAYHTVVTVSSRLSGATVRHSDAERTPMRAGRPAQAAPGQRQETRRFASQVFGLERPGVGGKSEAATSR